MESKEQAQAWTRFTTETDLVGGYRFDSEINEYRIKLLSGVPKRFYHSALNEIGLHFEEQIQPTLSK